MRTPRRTGRPNRLIVSPHLDDAVLSAWHAMADGPTTVVTVFAGIPVSDTPVPAWDQAAGAHNSAKLMQQRHAEDLKVLEAIEAQPVHLDFLDEQYRDGRPPTQAIIDALDQLVQDYDEVWLPAGVGGNPDHRIVAEAALAATIGRVRVMYADQPYATRDWSGVLASPLDKLETVEAWTKAVLDTSPLAPPRVPVVRHLDGGETMAKRAALAQYASQLPLLIKVFPEWWNDPVLFDKEWFWEMSPTEPKWPPLLLLPSPPKQEPTSEPCGPQDIFLSVIVRTKGIRPQLLPEALGSLAAQTSRDFELLVVAHDVTEANLTCVRDQLSALPSWLHARTSLLQAHGGTRSRPLNIGLVKAAGRYIAVLDDDDLALPGWVEEFARLEARHPGTVLHTRVARTSLGGQDELFPENFDLVDHLVGNRSPLCGLAFPRAWLTALGVSFDESLEVCEDWDLLLRIAPFCGVAVSHLVTSHYRYHGLGDARSGHSDIAWEVAKRTVIDKVNSKPLLLPAGSVNKLRSERELLGALEARLTVLESDLARSLAHLGATQAELAMSRAVMEEFRHSRSWRVTAPLRGLGDAARRVGLLKARSSVPRSSEGQAADQPEFAAAQQTVPVEYFETLYADNPDPWGFETEWYEERKYALTIDSLPKKRYRRAFEPGCGIGVLTATLATRCDSVISVDCVARAVRQAQDRVQGMAWVEVREMTVPDQWPEGSFDLIVISELARYFGDDDLGQLIDRTILSLKHGADLVLVHHRPHGAVPQSAEAVHGAFAARGELVRLGSYTQPEFLLDVLARAGQPAFE